MEGKKDRMLEAPPLNCTIIRKVKKNYGVLQEKLARVVELPLNPTSQHSAILDDTLWAEEVWHFLPATGHMPHK